MSNLAGKVIIVTGASRGIGAAAALALGKAGATLMLTARDGKLAGDVAQAAGSLSSMRAIGSITPALLTRASTRP